MRPCFSLASSLVSAAVVDGVTDAVSSDVARWIGLLSIKDVPLYINDLVFDSRSTVAGDEVRQLPDVVQVAWYLGVVTVAGLIIRERYRRFSA